MTTPMDDLGRVQQSDTLGTFRQTLLELGKVALAKHPVLNAMATQIRVTDQGAVWFTFDGPALPEKRNCEVMLPADPATHALVLDAFMTVCEETVARAMRQANYSYGPPRGVVGVGVGGGASRGQDFTTTCGDGATCGGGGNVAQGGGVGTECDPEPSFHGDGRVD